MPLTPGSSLGPYEIRQQIGEGGMGQVYLAHDSTLRRDVAIKVLPENLAADPDRLARFEREAQVLASLNHPSIAQIYGIEKSRGGTALVMEMVEGPTLADRIAEGPLPIAEALAIARQIAGALEAAHDKGIVHRDLKPANVKVRPDDTVKVLDFGLAKALGPDGGGASGDVANSPTLTARATAVGMILGTAAYMAPEQAKGKAVDKRADIWAFGVVLFEMLTGQRAFKGDDISDVLAAVLRQDIDWAALPRETPPGVRRLLQRCLARDPKQRLRDIGDAFLDIDAGVDPAPVPVAAAQAPAVPSSALVRWLPWTLAALTIAGSAAWTLWPAPEAPHPVVTRSRTPMDGFAAFADLSRDGSRLVYSIVGGQSGTHLALRSMDQFDAETLPGSDGAAFAIFSPDGQWIAYSTVSTPARILKIPVTGGTSITLCDGNFGSGAAWGDDDTIVFAGAKGLMRVPATGGTPQSLTTVDAAKHETAHARPQFLPGGQELLFTVYGAGAPEFAVLDPRNGSYRTIAKSGDNGKYVASGHLIYVRNGTLFAQPFDLAHLTPTGPEVPVVEDVSTVGPSNMADYSVSDRGLLVYFASDLSNRGTTLAWADRKGTISPIPGQATAQWGTGRLSPDGRLVANTIEGSGGADVWVLDVARGTPTRLTFDGGAGSLVWTPDSRRVIYAASIGGKSGLYTVPVDGSGKPTLLAAADSTAVPRSLTPDGKTLLYDQLNAEKRRQIFVVDLAAGDTPPTPRVLHDTASEESNGQVSPDGKWLLYESFESGTRDLYIQPFPGPGAKVRVSTGGGNKARWSHDGKEVYYWVGQPAGTLQAVAMDNGVPGPPQALFRLVAGTTWDVTPNRDRFLVETIPGSNGSVLATVTNWFEELHRRAPAKK